MSWVASAGSLRSGSAAPRPRDPHLEAAYQLGRRVEPAQLPTKRRNGLARREWADVPLGPGALQSPQMWRRGQWRIVRGPSNSRSDRYGSRNMAAGRPGRSRVWACAASVLPWTRAQDPTLHRDVCGVDHRRRCPPSPQGLTRPERSLGQRVPRAAVLWGGPAQARPGRMAGCPPQAVRPPVIPAAIAHR
jgi:hypothetical protein